MKYARIYADSNGESHFEDVEIQLQEADFAPPAPPVNLSAFNPATVYGFVVFPADWDGDWHPAPRRQIFFILSGTGEIETSDGEVRQFGSGSIVLLEDTSGKGHCTRGAAGTGDVSTAVVQLPE